MNVRLFPCVHGYSSLKSGQDKCQWDMIGQNTLISVLSDLALRFLNRLVFRIVAQEETSRTCHPSTRTKHSFRLKVLISLQPF